MRSFNINIITANPNDATSFYRAWGVWNQIRKRETKNIGLFEELKFGWNTIGKYDLLYLHRPSTKEHLESISIAKKNNVKVWVDYDDDLLNIPVHNRSYDFYKNSGEYIKLILEHSDIVTVSTQGLKDNLGFEKIQVVENFVPYDNFNMNKAVKKDKFRVLWRGSDTHNVDWYKHKDSFLQFAKSHDIQFVCIGDMPYEIYQEIAQVCDARVETGKRLIDYLLWLRTNVADLIFVPLEDNLFNRAKSAIACEEGIIGGMLSVNPSWNCATKFAYTDNVLEQLEKAYAMWDTNYDAYSNLVAVAQRDLIDNYRKRYNKRLQILNKII